MIGKLTELRVKNAKPGVAKYTMAAGHGLTLIVMPDGAKYWRLRYRFAGKARLETMALGPEAWFVWRRTVFPLYLLKQVVEPALLEGVARLPETESVDHVRTSQAALLTFYQSAAGGGLTLAQAEQQVVLGYHGNVAPFCAVAARSFFANF